MEDDSPCMAIRAWFQYDCGGHRSQSCFRSQHPGQCGAILDGHAIANKLSVDVSGVAADFTREPFVNTALILCPFDTDGEYEGCRVRSAVRAG